MGLTTLKTLSETPVFPVCILEGDHITTFSNHTLKWDGAWDLSTNGMEQINIRSLGSSGREVRVFTRNEHDYTDITITPNGDHFNIVSMEYMKATTVLVPTNAWKNLYDGAGNILAKITK